MNLLTISKKRTVTKLKDSSFIDLSGKIHITSHLDSRELIQSDIPGKRIVDSMTISDILCAKRH